MALTKPMRDVQRALEDEGFEIVSVSINKHVKWRVRLGEREGLVVTAITPSDHRSIRNTIRCAYSAVNKEY